MNPATAGVIRLARIGPICPYPAQIGNIGEVMVYERSEPVTLMNLVVTGGKKKEYYPLKSKKIQFLIDFSGFMEGWHPHRAVF